MQFKFVVILISVLLIQSCAAIISGARQEVNFKSNIDGARVLTNFDTIGYTNMAINVPRRCLNQMFTITKEGCIDTSFVLETRYNYLVSLDGFLIVAPIVDFFMSADVKTDSEIYIPLTCSDN
jgi:hypothetical protein